MSSRSSFFLMSVVLLVGLTVAHADLRITLPKRSKPTPVQKLNRDGVKAIQKHHYDEARKLFYKAYLLDPDDPFTLNNLGYISELDGDIERAQRYYDLAAQNSSDAVVDVATNKSIVGQAVGNVAGNAQEAELQVNRLNMSAMSLLLKDRAPEADVLLTRALAIDPKNPFTMNNLGFAKEQEGDLEAALRYYQQAASIGSQEPVVVTANAKWRGKSITEVAQRNAEKAEELMRNGGSVNDRVARLNLEGVSALNRNDRTSARNFFQEAYKLAPNDAFTLNNMGYLAELDGDRESANFYYQKAQNAPHNSDAVAVATRKEAEGQRLNTVADTSSNAVDQKMQQQLAAKRQQGGGPVVLKDRRTKQPIATPPASPTSNRPTVANPNQPNQTPENTAPPSNPPQTNEQPQQQTPPDNTQQQPQTNNPPIQ